MKVPFWATVFTILGTLILIGLGVWQLQRLEWKTKLLNQIEAEYAKNPMAFELTYDNLININPDRRFVRGFVEGVYHHDEEMALGPRTYEGKSGYHIITPFETLDNHIILVNRGWIPLDMKEGSFSRPEGALIISGTARRPEKQSLFVPENDPAQNIWYRLDLDDIAKAKKLKALLPYILYAENEGRKAYPMALATKWRPLNKHLGYALFWFNMAGVFLIIYYLRFIRALN